MNFLLASGRALKGKNVFLGEGRGDRMAVFDLTKEPNASNSISAAEGRTKLGTQGAPPVCGGVRARTGPSSLARGLCGPGTHLREAPASEGGCGVSTLAGGCLWLFPSLKAGSRGLGERLLIFPSSFFILFYLWPHAFH